MYCFRHYSNFGTSKIGGLHKQISYYKMCVNPWTGRGPPDPLK